MSFTAVRKLAFSIVQGMSQRSAEIRTRTSSHVHGVAEETLARTEGDRVIGAVGARVKRL